MKHLNFDESRALQLEMLKDITSFCDQNGIVYYLAFGTMLGAVRHQGFIPWDDDIDIMMTESNLKKFSQTYTSDKYEFISAENNKEHNLTFPRVYAKDTYSLMGNKKGLGVGVDIYGIYGTTINRHKHRHYVMEYTHIWTICRRLSSIRKLMARLRIWPKKDLGFCLLNHYVRKFINLQRAYSYEESCLCLIDTCPSLPIDKRIFDETVKLPFEGSEYTVPKQYDELLTLLYGKYMQLPPEDQRVPYHGDNFYRYE